VFVFGHLSTEKSPEGHGTNCSVRVILMAKKDDLEKDADLGVDPEGAIKETLDDDKDSPEDSDKE
jgi:hypothetical protein